MIAVKCEKCRHTWRVDARDFPFNCCGVRYVEQDGKIVKAPKPEPPQPAPAFGPGTELTAIFKDAGAKSDKCGGVCKAWRGAMNIWGVEGCQANRQKIIDRIKTAMFKTWVTDQIKIGWSLSREPWFNPLDPVGCIVDEAIRRADVTASLGSGS